MYQEARANPTVCSLSKSALPLLARSAALELAVAQGADREVEPCGHTVKVVLD